MVRPRTGRELDETFKMELVRQLQCHLHDGKLAYGALSDTAERFGVHQRTVTRIWKAFLSGNTKSQKAGRVGRKAKNSQADIQEVLGEVPQEQRTTFRDMAEATGLSLGTLHRSLKAGTVERKNSTIKPLLTDVNKMQRLHYCCAHVKRHVRDEAADEHEFYDMMDVVHLDEKWFNGDKDRRKVYLLPGEEPQYRCAKSKRFIPKVMFLTAVARPRHDEDRGVYFDGKLGMWPFIEYLPAMRSSRNRRAGTLQTKLVNVNAERYRALVLEKVLPAIMARFPTANKHVVLQHDNATPHKGINNVLLRAAATDGWSFVVREQPPNSPDLNVLDLGFFASIQALQYKVRSRTIDDVIETTLFAFRALSPEKLDDVFLTLQAVMRLVLEHQGSNGFKLPHLGKQALRRAGTRMVNLTCPASRLHEANYVLQNFGINFSQ